MIIGELVNQGLKNTLQKRLALGSRVDIFLSHVLETYCIMCTNFHFDISILVHFFLVFFSFFISPKPHQYPSYPLLPIKLYRKKKYFLGFCFRQCSCMKRSE